MNVRPDTVLNADSTILFQGSTEDAVMWLEMDLGRQPLWVSIGETGDLITSSEYLDLAS